MIHISTLQRTQNQNERLRLNRVLKNWQSFYDLTKMPYIHVYSEQLTRSARNVGEVVSDAPFVKDLIEMGLKYDDLVFLTNGDAHICSDALDILKNELWAGEAICSNRRNFFRPLRRMLTTKDIKLRGQDFVGVDSFVIWKRWWEANKSEIPDLLMGFEGWDWVFKKVIGKTTTTEITYHEYHRPYWFDHMTTTAGQVYNRKLCLEWAKAQPDYEEILAWWPALKTYRSGTAVKDAT